MESAIADSQDGSVRQKAFDSIRGVSPVAERNFYGEKRHVRTSNKVAYGGTYSEAKVTNGWKGVRQAQVGIHPSAGICV